MMGDVCTSTRLTNTFKHIYSLLLFQRPKGILLVILMPDIVRPFFSKPTIAFQKRDKYFVEEANKSNANTKEMHLAVLDKGCNHSVPVYLWN